MPVCETAGAGTLCVAQSRKRSRNAYASAVIDAAGGYRLEAADTHAHARVVGVENTTERARNNMMHCDLSCPWMMAFSARDTCRIKPAGLEYPRFQRLESART